MWSLQNFAYYLIVGPSWQVYEERSDLITRGPFLTWIEFSLSMDPDNKAHGANMGPIWGGQDPGGSHIGPMNFAIWLWYGNAFRNTGSMLRKSSGHWLILLTKGQWIGLWCYPVQVAEQMVEWSVVRDAMRVMWRHFNEILADKGT